MSTYGYQIGFESTYSSGFPYGDPLPSAPPPSSATPIELVHSHPSYIRPPAFNPSFRDPYDASLGNPYDGSWAPPMREEESLSSDILASVNKFVNNYSPFNFWEKSGESQFNPDRALFTIDCSTGDKYYYKKSYDLRLDQVKLFVFNFVPRILKTITYIAIKAIKVATFFEIVFERKSQHVPFKQRLFNYGKDILAIPASILHLVAINLSSIYGLVRANDGRKMYHKLSEVGPLSGINLIDNLEYKLEHFKPFPR